MAYGVYLGAVSERMVEALRRSATLDVGLDARAVGTCSHASAYWFLKDPVGRVLARAIDGGELLDDRFHHPLRKPRFVRPDDARTIFEDLVTAIGASSRAWNDLETLSIGLTYGFAAEHGLGVVTFLDRPFDEERASLVLYPHFTSPMTDEALAELTGLPLDIVRNQ